MDARRQDQVQRGIAAEMTRDSEDARRSRGYAETRLALGQDSLNMAVEARRGDVRAVAVYAGPDRFQREWSIARSFPFARRTPTVTPGAHFETIGPVPEDQEPVRLITARLLVPTSGLNDVHLVHRTMQLLVESDMAERRAELHEMITEFQTQGLQTDAIVREIETQIAGINDIIRRRRKNHVAQLTLLALTATQGAAAINMPLLGAAAGPTAVAGAALINRRWPAEPPPEEAAPLATLIAQARAALET